MPAAEVCRRHGLNPAAFYKFKAKYGGMNVSDIVWPSACPRTTQTPLSGILADHGFDARDCRLT